MFNLNQRVQSAGSVEIDLSALAANYRYLTGQIHADLMPVIKADAYGHGLIPCGKALAGVGAGQFAVGTVGEGVLLREAGFTCPLLALLGAVSKYEIELAIEKKIIVLAGSFSQLKAIAAHTKGREAQVALKFNTGMNRLGFRPEEIGGLFSLLAENPAIKPAIFASHLASADENSGVEFTRRQIAVFKEIAQAVKQQFPEIKASLYNSAGMLAYSKEYGTECARPGIALYGANPLLGTALNRPEIDQALKPVMQVKAPVVQVHSLRKGESISYGGTFTAGCDMLVAIVAAGYSQGYSRGVSNKSEMNIGGRRCRVLGRVCMQLTAVDVSAHLREGAEVKEGDFAYLLGGEGDSPITVQELSAWWGSIPYEVFCLMGSMNAREYK